MSSYIFTRLTVDLPRTTESERRILQCILDVVQLNWMDGWDEWARGYLIPEAILLDPMFYDGVDVSSRSTEVSCKFSPLSDYGLHIQICTPLDDHDTPVPFRSQVELSTSENAFFETRGDREKHRLFGGWKAFRQRAIHRGECPKLPPHTPEHANWWRRYEEVHALTEDVGADNFRYFMRIVQALRQKLPVTHYEECNEITTFESNPDQIARMDREIAEREARGSGDIE